MKNQPFGDTMGAPSKVTQCLGSPLGCWRPKRSPFGLGESPTTNDSMVGPTGAIHTFQLVLFPQGNDIHGSGSIRFNPVGLPTSIIESQ